MKNIRLGDQLLLKNVFEKEKENLFSVRGFETETSSFAPNGCLRVSTTQKFYARSDGWLRMIPRVLHIGHIYEKPAI